jgi:hypothetical protein
MLLRVASDLESRAFDVRFSFNMCTLLLRSIVPS